MQIDALAEAMNQLGPLLDLIVDRTYALEACRLQHPETDPPVNP